jgi:hypothetical protein
VLRFKAISTERSLEDPRIGNGFIRLLAAESARLGGDAPLVLSFEEQETPVRERYAPMQRLLARDDELFLIEHGARSSLRKLRREHRACYFNYLNRLTGEIRAARRLRTLAMASQQHWRFPVLLAYAVLSESSLFYLRWLGYRHALGITVAARDVRECLDFLLVAPKFAPATT